ATVVINLPENIPDAGLSTDWYVVWPNNGAIEHHYFNPGQRFEDGDTYTITGQWPGIDQWVEGNTVEVHFGAWLTDVGEPGEYSDGQDVYYNGKCTKSPPLELEFSCLDPTTPEWTLHNPTSISLNFEYT